MYSSWLWPTKVNWILLACQCSKTSVSPWRALSSSVQRLTLKLQERAISGVLLHAHQALLFLHFSFLQSKHPAGSSEVSASNVRKPGPRPVTKNGTGKPRERPPRRRVSVLLPSVPPVTNTCSRNVSSGN